MSLRPNTQTAALTSVLTLSLGSAALAETLWVSTVESVLGLDPATLAIRREISLDPPRRGGLNLLPIPDGRGAYLLSGGREVVSYVNFDTGKITRSWSLSELSGPRGAAMGAMKTAQKQKSTTELTRMARARIFGMALDQGGRRILANVLTGRLVGRNGIKLDRLQLDKPYLAWLEAKSGVRLATVTDVPWAISLIAPMEDPAYPNRFLIVGSDLDIIDLDRLAHLKGATTSGRVNSPLVASVKRPLRAAFKDLLVKHIPVREVYMSGQGPLVVGVEWFYPAPSGGLGSMPYHTIDPIVREKQVGIVTVDMRTGAREVLELGPALGPNFAFSSVVARGRKKAYAVFKQLFEVDLEKRRLTRAKPLSYAYHACTVSPDGESIYLHGGGARMARLSALTLEVLTEIVLPSDSWEGHILPD